MRVLIVGDTEFPFHDLEEHGAELVDAVVRGDPGPLDRDEEVSVDLTTDRDRFRVLEDYDVVVDYTTHGDFEDGQLEGLVTFVEGGGGYVGVHCAADVTSAVPPAGSDESVVGREAPVTEIESLLGGRFLTHPEQSTFGVEFEAVDHPITAGQSDFEVHDEPYDVTHDHSVQVLARMDHPDLGDVPVLWTREHGDGRVAYCSLGHTHEALTADPVRAIVARAVRWVAA